jgi:hypothetical protein
MKGKKISREKKSEFAIILDIKLDEMMNFTYFHCLLNDL